MATDPEIKQVAELLKRSKISPEDLKSIDSVSVSEYQVGMKGEDGEPRVVDLVSRRVKVTPRKDETGPKWPVIRQARPLTIKPVKRRQSPALLSGWKHAVLLPDPQIGFRKVGDDLIPMHDERAIDVALKVLAAVQHDVGVDQVVNLGDFLDLTEQSRFQQEPAFVQTTQPSIDYGSTFLAQQRATAPDAEMVLLEGNHDKRMQNFTIVNAAASFGIRKANAPESWPVMSLPYLLRCDEIDVHYIDAYPAGEYWINNKLRAIHGHKVRSSGSTANLYTKDFPGISTVFGHTHRVEMHHRTVHDRKGPIRTYAASIGCLCRVDGAVPSYGSGVGIDGKPVEYWEDWQQAVGVVTYKDDEAADHRLQIIQIQDGKAIYNLTEIAAA